jgi:hypothetical protein
MDARSVRARRALAWAAAVAGGVTDVGYLRLISEQQTAIDVRVAFVAAFIAFMTALALTGAVVFKRASAAVELLLRSSSIGFLGAGFVALFSIGTPLLMAAALAWIAAGPRRASGRLAAAAFVGPVALFVAGLVLTS